jgi:hypothetical protein
MRMIRVSDFAFAVIGHRAGFAEALGFVVHAAQADGIDVAPVVLALGVDGGVAVAFAGAGHQETAPFFGQFQQVPGALAVDLQGGDLMFT